MGRYLSGRRWGVLIVVLVATWVSLAASACVNDGTSAPCQCLMKMAVAQANGQTYVPVMTPSLSGVSRAVATPAYDAVAAAAFAVTVDDTFYDYNGDGLGNVTINLNDTVHWENTGFAAHTVTTVPNAPVFFDSGVMFNGDTFDQTFTVPGKYIYYCQVHSSRNGNTATGPQVGTITVVAPEPGGLALLGVGFGGLLAARRRGRTGV